MHLCEGQYLNAMKDRGEQLANQFAGRLLLHPAHFMERLKLLERANGTIDKLDEMPALRMNVPTFRCVGALTTICKCIHFHACRRLAPLAF